MILLESWLQREPWYIALTYWGSGVCICLTYALYIVNVVLWILAIRHREDDHRTKIAVKWLIPLLVCIGLGLLCVILFFVLRVPADAGACC